MAKDGKSKKRQFYFKFVAFVFYIILATYLVLGVAFIVLKKANIISVFTPLKVDITVLLFLFLFGALALGVIIACFCANIFLRPINRISEATKKVANGDFSVELPNPDADNEMGELIDNFNRMVRDLRNIEILKSDFIADVSHEFKTPLSTIQGYSTLLQDESLSPEDRRQYAHIIIEATKQLSAMTSNILKLDKLENRDCDLEKNKFNIAEQIRGAILSLESKWSEKELDLDIDLEDAELNLNEELVMQVWTNIIGNAIKFTDKNGKIVVNSRVTDEGYRVVVADNGIGMDRATVERIFEKFYQGDASHAKEGNGLGLALVKKILDRVGGTIYVRSKPGEGSEFTVTLPMPEK